MPQFEAALKKSKIILSTHVFASGFAQYLEEYLVEKKTEKILYIHHPLHLNENKSSGYRFYNKGILKTENKKGYKTNLMILSFLLDFLSNIFWVIKTREKWDLYIGSNNLNAIGGVILQKLGFVRKSVFYTVDFVPNRFSNKPLNSFYLWIDKICVENCDETWIVSPRMRDGRHEYLSLNKKYNKKQILVPEGVWLKRINKEPLEKIEKHTAVFVGHLVERMGVQEVIRAIPSIIKKVPDFKFVVIGTGDYLQVLKRFAKNLSVYKYIDFKGYIKDHRDVEKIIARCEVGIACYREDKESFTYYAEPSKTKVYMGSGLPVVMTDMFYNAKDIEKAGAGIVVEYNKDSIARGVLKFIGPEKNVKAYRKNVSDFIKDYDWEYIFERNLLRVLRS